MLMNLQLPWKFVVGLMYMDLCNFSSMVLVGGVSSCVSSYVTNSTLQCVDYSKVQSIMMVLGEYVCDIPPTGGKAFILSTTKQNDLNENSSCNFIEW